MNLHRLEREQYIDRPLGDVFHFFAEAHNLERITPPWLSFEVLTPDPIEMGVGVLIDYRLRVHGLPLRWTSRIEDWEPGRSFVDRRLRGPYGLWPAAPRGVDPQPCAPRRRLVSHQGPGNRLRWGERWFMRYLLDGDQASNNGNWQWIASVGVDPAPAFRRIFNPARQQERFDPGGAYVRAYVPELAGVPDRYLAEPWTMPEDVQDESGCRIGRDYPEPIVDHAEARRQALDRYRGDN